METAPSPTPPAPFPRSPPRWGKTVALWELAVLIVPLLAAHFPPRLKLMGLFSIGLALVSTWLIIQGGRLSSISFRAVALVVLVGLPIVFAIYLGESFRDWRAAQYAHMRQHILSQPGGGTLWEQLQQSDQDLTDFEREMAQVYRERLDPTFSDFLRERSQFTVPIRREPLRLSPMGTMTLRVGEIILGLLAGGFLLFRPRADGHPSNTPRQEQNA